jgi:enterobactin synthetase component D
LFPDFVTQHTVHFDESDPRDLGAQFPGVSIPGQLASAVRKRQAEFAAGRYCVREALLRCSPDDADTPIGSGRSREPLWPAGIVGAITHTHRYASVAVARTRDARGLGLDAELWMKADVAANVVDHIADRAEVDAVIRATGFSSSHALTLIFSAKETLFKCLFPEVKRYFDFRDASLVSVDSGRGDFTMKLLVTLTPFLRAGDHFGGRFEHDSRLVCTGMLAHAS